MQFRYVRLPILHAPILPKLVNTIQWEIFAGAKFMELLVNPLEEIFMVLIFTPSPRGDHTHVYMWSPEV